MAFLDLITWIHCSSLDGLQGTMARYLGTLGSFGLCSKLLEIRIGITTGSVLETLGFLCLIRSTANFCEPTTSISAFCVRVSKHMQRQHHHFTWRILSTSLAGIQAADSWTAGIGSEFLDLNPRCFGSWSSNCPTDIPLKLDLLSPHGPETIGGLILGALRTAHTTSILDPWSDCCGAITSTTRSSNSLIRGLLTQ
jgi:hypothetical protein